MVSEPKQHKKQKAKSAQSLYNYNRRKLKIALERQCISKEDYNQIKNVLDEEIAKGLQPPIEELLSSFLPSSVGEIQTVINKDIFKYHQIIIKLAQQFAKNTTNQQFKLQNSDPVSLEQANKKLQDVFSKILKDITNGYLTSNQRNIDDILLESGFIQESQLEFLHSSAEHLEIKAQDRKFGEIAVTNEFTTQEIVNKALDEQTERYKKTSKNHIIGDILVEQQHITPETRNEILIIQNRVMEEDWEETLKEVGQSSIEEREKSAMFGALILKERLLDEKKIVDALKIQAKEFEAYRQQAESEKNLNDNGRAGQVKENEGAAKSVKPRWIGDILVQDFGLSERDRKRIVKKQMDYKIERINLKFGLNLSNSHIELFNEMEQYFEISYSNDKVEAYIKVLKPVPKTMTKDNIVIWLYNKKISYGRIATAIESLIANKVKPGKTVLLAKGDEPIAAQMRYKFHFDIKSMANYPHTNAHHLVSESSDARKNIDPEKILSSIVLKGTKLITLEKVKGKSGLNVNHCFVAPSMVTPLNVIKGENITRNDNSFIASCDGLPHFSDNRVLSLSPLIHINSDITSENIPKNLPAQLDCDFNIRGKIQSGVVLGCRQLKALYLNGKVTASDDVTILSDTVNGEIISKGNVNLQSVENSLITSEKSIAIQLHSDDSNTSFNKIYNSVITSNDISRISDAKIVSSVIRAKNKVILKKVTVGERCKFIVGDNIETISYKKSIEELNNDIETLELKIKTIQEQSRELFDKIEKKDIAEIDKEIKDLSKNQRTKEDLDRISELRVMKRQKEKEYEASVDKYGSLFMQNSQQSKQYQEHKNNLEKKRKELSNHIMDIYKKEQEIPEIDIRHTMLPAGTLIQFRYNKQVLKSDCEGFVFREEFHRESNRYELKQHRW
ncbi:MAG: hypothetical protein HQK73_02715 [Desulfamplus sp.]|nr:hypothetical protein [Desulfamplus sp.]